MSGAVIEPQAPDRLGRFTYRRHAPRPLPSGHRPVVIAGGGPVGLAVALGLQQFGIPSLIIEADDTVCVGSRAACISRRSLEILGRLGVLDAFLAKGLPWRRGRSFYRQTEVFSFDMPSSVDQRLPPMVNLQQYYIEEALLHGIDARCVEVAWSTSVTSVRPHDGGVTVGLENATGSRTIEADWLVACDGGQSFVRKSLGLNLDGTAYDGRYVIIDIELPSTHPTERRAWFDPPWNPGSTVLMHRQPDDLWRIDYQLRHGESTEAALEPDAVRAFVQRHLDAIGEGHLPWTPVWTSVYRAGAMTLDRYRHGRVLFAGNAAHAMPIFGVRGLNSGFDDADNLAWKLASVCRGDGPEALLDSYSSERVRAFHLNAEAARRSTEFMSPPSRGFDLMREAVLSLAERERGIAQLINPRQTEAVNYRGSPLNTEDASDAQPFDGGPRPGDVLPEHPLAGGHLTERLGAAFTLLRFGSTASPGAPSEGFSEQLRQVVIDEAAVAAAFGAAPGAAYLLRPDGHVAARWQQPLPKLVHAAWRRALGHSNP